MDFAFSEEQDLLRASARGWLATKYPPARVATIADGEPGWDPASWAELGNLGWLDPELGLLEYAVLAEETGYALYPGPWWSTVGLAAPVLGTVPERPATVAWAETGATDLRTAGRAGKTAATQSGDGWTVTGTKVRVPELNAADLVLVVAATADGSGVWAIPTDQTTVHMVSTVDRTRRLGQLHLDAVPAELVIAPGDACAALDGARRRVLAVLACEAVGVAQRALDLSSAYAKERKQFGRPIGTFQAVSHRIADIFTAVQLARSLAYRAAWCVQYADTESEIDEAVASASVAAGQGAVFACESAMQAMGGIGFTWDHPLQRVYKRAQAIAAFDGGQAGHRAELATALLGG